MLDGLHPIDRSVVVRDVTPGLIAMIMSRTQAAEYLGCSYSYLYQLKAAGRGPAWFPAGSRVKYHKADIDAWIEQRRIAA